MRVHSLCLGFLLLRLLSFCNADPKIFEIVGAADCVDCQLNNFKTSHAFTGLHVTIDCKLDNDMERVGDGELDGDGKFKISLPKEMIGGVKKRNCYAQLHSAAAPCPAHGDGGVEATKIVFKSQIEEKVTYSPAEALKFSTALCTSKLLWPLFAYPPLPKSDPWKKDWPRITIPPLKKHPWKKNWPKVTISPPIVKMLPPPVPIYKPKPKPPVFKPKPPVPIYKPKPKPKPKTSVVKPLPPHVPVYKPPTKPIPPPFYKPTPKPPVVKPLPPSEPIYKPPAVKPLPPPVPIYEPPVVTKPLPPPFPLFPLPPLYKKPCPPFAKFPPKSFEHPKFGYFPKLPPFNPNP